MPPRVRVGSRLLAHSKRRRLPRPPDPEEQITVVLGASEGMAAAFRSLLAAGDGVVAMQPITSCTRRRRRSSGWCRFVTLRGDRLDRRAGTCVVGWTVTS